MKIVWVKGSINCNDIYETVVEDVNQKWAEQVIRLWDRFGEFTDFQKTLKLVDNECYSECHADGLIPFYSNKTGSPITYGLISNIAIAATLIDFWNKNNWVVGSKDRLTMNSGNNKQNNKRSFKIVSLENTVEHKEIETVAENMTLDWAMLLVDHWNRKYKLECSTSYLKVLEQNKEVTL